MTAAQLDSLASVRAGAFSDDQAATSREYDPPERLMALRQMRVK